MFADAVGMADPAAALAESSRLTLKSQDPLHHATAVAGSIEIHQFMGPPDCGYRRPLSPFDGRGLLPQLASQMLHQLFIIGSRAGQGASSQQALAGGSRGEEEGEAIDTLGCGGRWVQKGLMPWGSTPAARLPGCPD